MSGGEWLMAVWASAMSYITFHDRPCNIHNGLIKLYLLPPTQTHIHTHARTDVHMHARTRTHTRMHRHTHACTHTHTHTHTLVDNRDRHDFQKKMRSKPNAD